MVNKLLFIGGFPGGGTDLTKTILNSHPDIYINGEMPFLYKLDKYGIDKGTVITTLEEERSLKKILEKINTWNNFENINHSFSKEIAENKKVSLEEFLHLYFSDNSPQIWGNKTPQNTEHIAALDHLFPNSRFIIVLRDVRDVCLSWNNKWGKNLNLCAAKWSERMMLGWRDCQALTSDRYLFIKYEDLITLTEATIHQMCDFLGIQLSRRMLDHDQYTGNKIDGKINYGRGIISDNLEKWRSELSSKQVQRIEEIAFEGMQLFDYQIEFALKPIPLRASEKYSGYIKDSLAILTIGNQASGKNRIASRVSNLIFELRKIIINN